MRIVPQSAPASYSLLPTSLALPAPKIAGLLGPGPQPDRSAYSYSDPRLAAFTDEQRTRLFDAADTLLEIAVRFATRELSDTAVRAAASLFARKLTGRPATRYQGPEHFRAEQDADLLDWLLGVEKRNAARAKRDPDEWTSAWHNADWRIEGGHS